MPDPVVLGRVSGLFGVRGWVKVFSYTEPREALLNYETWLLKKKREWQPVQVAEGKRQGKSIVVRLEGFVDRDQAADLIGSEIGVSRSDLPEAGEGKYYWSDLKGMKVVHRDGSELGSIDYLLETGAHDVMVLEGERERLIPFVMDDTVLEVDLEGRIVTVDWEWD